MDWRVATAVGLLVGCGSGVVCAKEYQAFRATAAAAAAATVTTNAPATLPVGAAAFPDVGKAPPPAPGDPALELLASNPYTAQLSGYKAALTVEGEHPLLEDPYAETMRFANPYENTVGIANPYVDALRESQMRLHASLANPYTAKLRGGAANPENPYARRRR